MILIPCFCHIDISVISFHFRSSLVFAAVFVPAGLVGKMIIGCGGIAVVLFHYNPWKH